MTATPATARIEMPEPVLCLDCGKDTNFKSGFDPHRLVWRASRTGLKTTLCLDCVAKRCELAACYGAIGGER